MEQWSQKVLEVKYTNGYLSKSLFQRAGTMWNNLEQSINPTRAYEFTFKKSKITLKRYYG